MVIHSEMKWNDTYTMRMISGNKIPGLLEFQEKQLDGVSMFYYDITSKQPLIRLLERRKMAGNEIHTLVSDLILVLKRMERYLLDEQRICLKAEYIYIDPETCHGSFCMIPGYQSDFSKEFFDFAQYILDHVDHSDGEAVVLAFSIFRESRKENFGVADIERCLEKGLTKAETPKIQEVKPGEVHMEERSQFCEQEAAFPSIYDEKENDRSKQKILGVCVIVGMAVIPIGCTGLFGIHFLMQWKWVMAAFEILAATVGVIAYYFLNNDVKSELQPEDETEFELKEWVWEVDEDCETEQRLQSAGALGSEEEDDLQTVLLISQTELSHNRKLISLSNRKEIPVDYFPFLIGKNKDMVDTCLNEPGISRLHAKLEREGADYYITDLNSTNGTKINGVLLGANEKKQIHIGDELDFAGILFRFQ